MTLELDGLLYQGTEAFTVGEKIKVFFSELSLSIDTFNASAFNSSIHLVDARKTIKRLKEKNTYFKYSDYQIPTPVFFNPKKITFPEYVDLCLEAINMLDHTNDELTAFYDAIKQTISTGILPFTVLAKKDDRYLLSRKARIETYIENTGYNHRAVSQVYPNIATFEKTIDDFNRKAKTLSSRDVEITTKKVNNLIDLLKILKRKVDVSDINLKPEAYYAIKNTMARTNELVVLTGTMIGMMNELSQTLKIQTETFESFVTK